MPGGTTNERQKSLYDKNLQGFFFLGAQTGTHSDIARLQKTKDTQLNRYPLFFFKSWRSYKVTS